MRFGNRTYEESRVDAALAASETPGEVLAELPPPLPQIDLWRPRMGYDDRALGINDVLAFDRRIGDNSYAWTGGPHEWTASPRMTENFW
jgi:hypothetical protein